jgi:glucoamylase
MMMKKITIPSAPFTTKDVDAVIQNLLKNIATSSNALTRVENNDVTVAMPGAVIAAPALPSNEFSQAYYFHWVRDGAIVMSIIEDLYLRSNDKKQKAYYREIMVSYLDFVEKIQSQPWLNGVNVLGEPKFNVDGSLWTGAWGRPQIASAGDQVIALTKIAAIFLDEEKDQDLVNKIYNTNPNSLLKANLEYCATLWSAPSVNMWEELSGNHFSVRLMQRSALLIGAVLAERLGDGEAAAYYRQTALHINNMLETHWHEHLGYYFETPLAENQQGGGIDVSVLISLFYGQQNDIHDEFSVTQSRVLSTAFYVRSVFKDLYQINVARHINDTNCRAWLIGRYEIDIYDGNRSIYGNPWFLSSNLLAALYYSIIKELLLGKKILVNFLVQQFCHQVAPELKIPLDDVIESSKPYFSSFIECLFREGDAILEIIKQHCATYDDNTTMHMSEQIDRFTGKQASANDLSWSYSSYLSAVLEREKVIELLK